MTDALISDGISRETVDATIASGIRLLIFPRRLEAAFEQETNRQRCRQLFIGALIGLAIYDLFLIVDWWVTPDIFVTALWVRLGIMTPVGLALTAALYLYPPVFVRECMVAVGGAIFATITVFYLMLLSHSPHQDSQHQSVILIILFLTVAQRVRFWYSVPTCAVCFGLHVFALGALPDYPFDLEISADMVFGGVIIFSLIASYMIERELRLNYLLSLRGRLQNRELDMISRHDPLTGVGNRRSLDEILAACERGMSPSQELSLMLLDIDHFKLFNDSAGHQAGDICLKRVAGIIQGELRGHSDHAFRFGGEEFLILLRDTGFATAIEVAERVRGAIETEAIPHPALAPRGVVTASFGVASALRGRKMRAADIIARADEALYEAKRNGRNQVWPRFLAEIVDLQDWKSL
jgi:diguanylate cyclase (GGDEF)-like protein